MGEPAPPPVFAERSVRLGDGAEATLRRIAEADAAGVRDLTVALAARGVGVVRTPAEVNADPAEHGERIRRFLEARRGLWIVADVRGMLAGQAELEVSSLRRLAHRAWFSVGIHPRHQQRGLGRALSVAALEHASAMGLTRVELGVFATNTPAIALYEILGFVREGVRRRFIRYEDGRYDDDIVMARIEGGA